MKLSSILLGLLFVFVAPSGQAAPSKSALDLSKAKSRVEFLAIANPTAVEIRGRSTVKTDSADPLKGKLVLEGKNITGETTFAVDSLNTGIEMRDRHMKEKYLETAKFPEAKLKLTQLALPEAFTGAKLEKKNIPFTGDLTLHGVTKPMTGTVDFLGEGKTLDLYFNFKVKISEYSIPAPKFLAISVADEVSITVALEGATASETASAK